LQTLLSLSCLLSKQEVLLSFEFRLLPILFCLSLSDQPRLRIELLSFETLQGVSAACRRLAARLLERWLAGSLVPRSLLLTPGSRCELLAMLMPGRHPHP
jgi:hypothetical protein